MIINIITVFPDIIENYMSRGIMKRREEAGIEVNIINLRDFPVNSYGAVDDYPYGGFSGMLLRPEPVYDAVSSLTKGKGKTIFTTPQGKRFTQSDAKRLAQEEILTFICGRYKGLDERVRENLVDEEFSIGDFVLSGGELPVLTIADAVIRLVPGIVGDAQSALDDSFEDGFLDGPYYTRPSEYMGKKVPEILLSGNHAKINEWFFNKKLIRTYRIRPDLLTEDEIRKAELLIKNGESI